MKPMVADVGRKFLLATSLLLGALSCAAQAPAPLAALTLSPEARVVGPMLGHVTMRSARLWAQWAPGGPADAEGVRLHVEYWPQGQPEQRRQSAPVTASALDDWTARWQLSGLAPGQTYEYRVLWRTGGREGQGALAVFTTVALWQWRTDPPALRVLAGSCAYTDEAVDDRPGAPYGRDPAIYSVMASQAPNVTLWMGDNIYWREPDFDDETAMSARYAKWRSLPQLQPLLRTGSHLATWDDHDYGPNDANSSYPFKHTSLKLFERYWANPTSGLPGVPGVFTRAMHADVEFFVLDGRWYRDADKRRDPDKQLFGEVQLNWLRNALVHSSATFKVIVSGSQLFNDLNRFEGWNHFSKERQGFVDWLTRQRVPGVVFLSGDRHFAAAFRVERPGSYPLHEFTCSPLSARAWENPDQDRQGNPNLIEGSVVGRNNFCQLDFTGKRGARVLQVQIKDAQGQVAWTHTIEEKALR